MYIVTLQGPAGEISLIKGSTGPPGMPGPRGMPGAKGEHVCL